MGIVGSKKIFSQQEASVKTLVRSAAAYMHKRDVENIKILKITLIKLTNK
jgi:hypothetical protein